MKNLDLIAIDNLFIKNPIVSNECELKSFFAINILRNKNHCVMEILHEDNKIDFIDYRAYEAIMLDENNMVLFVYDSFYKFWHIDFRGETKSQDFVIAKKDNPIFDYIKRPQYYVDLDSDCLNRIYRELDKQDLYLVIDDEGYADIVTKDDTSLNLFINYESDSNEQLKQILLEHYF